MGLGGIGLKGEGPGEHAAGKQDVVASLGFDARSSQLP